MTIEYRPPNGDAELRAAMSAVEHAFGDELGDDDWERERKLVPEGRSLAAYDGDRVVGYTAAYQFDLTVPGGRLPCAGVTWVGVLPSHRRRGILRELMKRQLDQVAAWGEPIAALWASEASIYGRFGYGVAAPSVAAHSRRDRFAFRSEPPVFAARLVEADEAYRLFPALYERLAAARPGMLSRSETWWRDHRLTDPESSRRGASRKFYAVLEADGEPQAYAIYRVKGEWEDGFPKGEVRVMDAFALTPAAELALWRFLHGIDLVAKVEVYQLDPASALVLGVRDPRALGLTLGDGLWLRLVDLDTALRARSYRPGRSVVLEVRDDLCPWNDGRYRVGDDAGRTEDTADLALDVADLASAYLGAFDFHRLVRAGRAVERREGAAEDATLLFRTELPPYCPEVF